MAIDPRDVRTANDGDVVAKIVGSGGANQLAIDANGDLSVDISEAEDSILIYGNDGTNNQPIKTDSSGAVDVSGATVTVTDDGSFNVDAVLADVNTGGAQTNNLLIDIAAQSTGALDVSGATVTVTDNGSFAATVSQTTHDNLNANANLQVSDTDVSDTNPVPVVEVDAEAGNKTPQADHKATASLSPGSSETLSFALSASVTGRLQDVLASAEVPWKAEIQKTAEDGTTTTIGTLYGEGGDHAIYEPKNSQASLYEVTSDASPTASFDVVCTNNGPSTGNSGAVEVTLAWDEE